MTRHPRGFALIIVLWAVIALAVGGALLVSTGRRALTEADAAGAAARTTAALDSAAQQAIFHLLAPGAQNWPPLGTRSVRAGDRTVNVSLDNLAGAVNLNSASPALLAGLLAALDRPPAEAASLAAAIVEWRSNSGFAPGGDPAVRYRAAGRDYAPPAAPFQSLGELGLVLGMTPDLLARLRPYLTLWGDGDPDPALAAPPVRAALRSAGLGSATPGASGKIVVAITCRIEGGPGRRTIVQLLPAAERPFRIVDSQPLPAE